MGSDLCGRTGPIAIELERVIDATNKAHALMFPGRAKQSRALFCAARASAPRKTTGFE